MWTLCAVLFTLFSDEGVDRHFLEISSSEYCCSQWRQLYNVSAGGTNKSETEMNEKRTEWEQQEGLSEISCQSQALTEKVKRLWADGDSDQRWEIRPWYCLKVKRDVMWNNFAFKEAECHSKERHNPLWDISTEQMFAPEIITITVTSGSVITPRWRRSLLNCHGAPCLDCTHTLCGCPQAWLTVCLLHFFDIFTTQRINTT